MANMNNLSLLAEPTARLIFNKVVEKRRIRFGDLVKKPPSVNQTEARKYLDKLENANLISKKGSPVEDFIIYFVTADGLTASRKLRQMTDW